MALALTLKSKETFTVGEVLFELESVKKEPCRFIVRNVLLGRSFNITDERSTEILPGVYVSAGLAPATHAKVVIEAPQEVRIIRGERRRRPQTQEV